METEFTATSLSPFTNYTFEVAAVTSAGAGMSAVLTVTTDQAGKIRLGTLSYPLLLPMLVLLPILLLLLLVLFLLTMLLLLLLGVAQ
jgi:hypothetical protein